MDNLHNGKSIDIEHIKSLVKRESFPFAGYLDVKWLEPIRDILNKEREKFIGNIDKKP